MQGDENEKFNPKDNITKEQVIVTFIKIKWYKLTAKKMNIP